MVATVVGGTAVTVLEHYDAAHPRSVASTRAPFQVGPKQEERPESDSAPGLRQEGSR